MKKGFTLIELLAVIVILAIIALIVTPVVSNIVSNAKIAANARSVEGHIRNIELSIISEAFGTDGDMNKYDNVTSGSAIEAAFMLPTNDNVTCTSYTISNGTIQAATGCKEKNNSWSRTYTYSIANGAVANETEEEEEIENFEFNGTKVAASEGDTFKGIVYIDPKNPETACTADSELTNTNTGCKKFYIYDDSGSKYKMIMDRNLGDNVEWVSLDYVTEFITDGEHDSFVDFYNYNIGILTNGQCSSYIEECIISYLTDGEYDSMNELQEAYDNGIIDDDYLNEFDEALTELFDELDNAYFDLYNQSDLTTLEPVTLNAQLAVDTAGWIGSPRIITADEIAHIVGADREDTIKWNSTKTYIEDKEVIDYDTEIRWFNFDGGISEYSSSYEAWHKTNQYNTSHFNVPTTEKSNYAWLYDYLDSCIISGCNTELSGAGDYWTSNIVISDDIIGCVWKVKASGGLVFDSIFETGNTGGIRPVLEITKSLID